MRSLSGADHVCEDAVGAGHTGWQLSKPGIGRKNVYASSVTRVQHSTRLRFLVRIVGLNDGLVMRIPFRGEIQAALLHPAFEVPIGNFVRSGEERMIGIRK